MYKRQALKCPYCFREIPFSTVCPACGRALHFGGNTQFLAEVQQGRLGVKDIFAQTLKRHKKGDAFRSLTRRPALTAEMLELVRSGYENIVCAQPFGCLPNHICGKGMINKIRELYPQANITPIDYDPSATRVNQENRIKLMLAVAKERLNAPAEAQPLTAEQLAGGAPQVGATV